MRPKTPCCLAVLALALPAAAQRATVLIRENGPVPARPGVLIQSISGTARNAADGFAARVDASDLVSLEESLVWGVTTATGAGGPIFTEGSHAAIDQIDWGPGVGMDAAGRVVYTATYDHPSFGLLDSVWLDGTPIAQELSQSTLPGFFWTEFSRVGTTQDGRPYFIGGTAPGAANTRLSGLFLGTFPLPVLIGGTSLQNVPGAIADNPTIADFAIGETAGHYIVAAWMQGAPVDSDQVVVYDGVGLVLGGKLVREGQSIPLGIGGLGNEQWGEFEHMVATDGGGWAFGARTSGPESQNQVLVADGSIALREGDRVDGFVLGDRLSSLTRDSNANFAMVWSVTGSFGVEDALFYNRSFVLRTGYAVDLDADGTADPGAILRSIEPRSLQIDSAGRMFVVGTIDVAGTPATGDDLDVFLRILRTPEPATYCTAATSQNGCTPTITAHGSPSASAGSGFDIVTSGVDGQRSGMIFYGTAGPASFLWGAGPAVLCVRAPLQRTGMQNTGGEVGECDGSLGFDLGLWIATQPGALGQPFGAGDTVWAQGWWRDPGAAKNTNLTNGIEVTLLP